MIRLLLVRIAVSTAVLVGCGVITLVAAVPADASRPAVGRSHSDTGISQCKHGSWRTLSDDHGSPFRNQGQCVKWMIHHPDTLADLAGTFDGTQSFTFNANGCNFIDQVFDATYSVSAAVGTVGLHVDGCVTPLVILPTFEQFDYSGSFTITTNAGELTGSVAGQGTTPSGVTSSLDYELTLTIDSGTGSFAGSTGTVHVTIEWSGLPSITGSVTL